MLLNVKQLVAAEIKIQDLTLESILFTSVFRRYQVVSGMVRYVLLLLRFFVKTCASEN